jgi:RNA polymerase sigma-70 factor (ECF subfamily)
VSGADIEDFAQDALVKILASLDGFRGESRFTTWARKIAVRVAFTELRRRRWKDVSLQGLLDKYGDGDFTPALLADSSPAPPELAMQGMVAELLRELIENELTARQRDAMTAVMAGHMPLEEVARRMGTNRNALYKLLHDARLRLKQLLEMRGLSAADVLAAYDA